MGYYDRHVFCLFVFLGKVCGVGAKYFKTDVVDSPDHGSTDRWSHIREMDCTNIKGLGGASGKEPSLPMQETWDVVSVPESSRSSGRGHGNSLQ